MSSNGVGRAAEQEQPRPSYFQSQRALLVSDIAQSLDSVLTNLNRLNRSLEAVIAVGNEFSSVEALWSTFEGVMADRAPETESDSTTKDVNASNDGNDKSSDT